MQTEQRPKRRWLGPAAWLACLALGAAQGFRAHSLRSDLEHAHGAWLTQQEQIQAMALRIVELDAALDHSDAQVLFWQRQATAAGARWLICDNERTAAREECLRRAGFWR